MSDKGGVSPETRAAWEDLQRRYLVLEVRYGQERGWTWQEFMRYFHYGAVPTEKEHRDAKK